MASTKFGVNIKRFVKKARAKVIVFCIVPCIIDIFRMDPRTSAQDVYRCELCDENMVDMLCVECSLKLCKSCVGNHIADEPCKHKLVKFQDRNATLVLPTCPTHSSARCKNFCKECDEAVCPSCISSNSHKKHTFLTIFEIFRARKEVIDTDTKELEKIVFSSYRSIVQQVEFDAAKLKTDYKTLILSIENKRRRWHEEIDKIVNMLRYETDEMRDIQLNGLNKHLQKVKELRTEIEDAIKANKDLLHSQNVTKTLSYKSRNSALKCLPNKLKVSCPKFISKPINGDLIADMFGVIVGFSISEQIERCKKKTQNIRQGVFLDKAEIQSAFETKMQRPEKVACQSNRKLWVAGNEGYINLFKFERQNDVLQPGSGAIDSSLTLKQVNVNKGPTDISVTRTGDLVYGIKLENTIFILKQDKAEVLINLHDWKLLSLCITECDELLVCMVDKMRNRCRVVRFDQVSEKMQIMQYDQHGNSLYTPGMLNKHIEENRNGDICLADFDAGEVIVTDKAAWIRFRYIGRPLSQKDVKFCPSGIATDSGANILVSDSLKVHIIDKNGQFLHFLNIACSNPLRLAIDEYDNLYIAEVHGNVKMVRYIKEGNFFFRGWQSFKKFALERT